MTIAALDIGTNTLLLLIARFDNGTMHVLADEHHIARLGEGVDLTGTISPDAVERARQIIERYANLADAHSATIRVAVGTSVFRSATNAHSVAAVLASHWGAPIEIISGDQEAELTYLGTAPRDERAGVLDIGGGSTELIVGSHGTVHYRKSIEIGAVRLTERFWQSFPPSEQTLAECRNYVYAQLQAFRNVHCDGRLYAVAGTPTTLALMACGIDRFEPSRIDGFALGRDLLEELCQKISTARLEQLRMMPGVHPQRADILPAGTLILRSVMDVLGLDSVIVSMRGLRYGVAFREFERLCQQHKLPTKPVS
jgi:exopolyphosphatase/guanosine-5'-triphosphate,3'-diphosphate pyrophosphatase